MIQENNLGNAKGDSICKRPGWAGLATIGNQDTKPKFERQYDTNIPDGIFPNRATPSDCKTNLKEWA